MPIIMDNRLTYRYDGYDEYGYNCSFVHISTNDPYDKILLKRLIMNSLIPKGIHMAKMFSESKEHNDLIQKVSKQVLFFQRCNNVKRTLEHTMRYICDIPDVNTMLPPVIYSIIDNTKKTIFWDIIFVLFCALIGTVSILLNIILKLDKFIYNSAISLRKDEKDLHKIYSGKLNDIIDDLLNNPELSLFHYNFTEEQKHDFIIENIDRFLVPHITSGFCTHYESPVTTTTISTYLTKILLNGSLLRDMKFDELQNQLNTITTFCQKYNLDFNKLSKIKSTSENFSKHEASAIVKKFSTKIYNYSNKQTKVNRLLLKELHSALSQKLALGPLSLAPSHNKEEFFKKLIQSLPLSEKTKSNPDAIKLYNKALVEMYKNESEYDTFKEYVTRKKFINDLFKYLTQDKKLDVKEEEMSEILNIYQVNLINGPNVIGDMIEKFFAEERSNTHNVFLENKAIYWLQEAMQSIYVDKNKESPVKIDPSLLVDNTSLHSEVSSDNDSFFSTVSSDNDSFFSTVSTAIPEVSSDDDTQGKAVTSRQSKSSPSAAELLTDTTRKHDCNTARQHAGPASRGIISK